MVKNEGDFLDSVSGDWFICSFALMFGGITVMSLDSCNTFGKDWSPLMYLVKRYSSCEA